MSLKALRARLRGVFRGKVSKVQVFGSFKRGTNLPRRYDDKGDVDVLITFKDNLAPQSYLTKLKDFADAHYPEQRVQQSSPAVVLQMNLIRFELVPAIVGWDYALDEVLQIPAPRKAYLDWQVTDPEAFNARLTAINKQRKNLVKPLVRIMKYWNAHHGKPFPTYELEKNVVEYAEWSGFQTLEEGFLGYADYLWEWVEKGQRKAAIRALNGTVDSLRRQAGNEQAKVDILGAFLPIR